MIEHQFPYESLIGGWYLPEKICDDLIDFYNKKENHWTEGHAGDKYLPHIKKCTEIYIKPNVMIDGFKDYVSSLDRCLENYLEKYKEANRVWQFKVVEPFKIQHYKKGEGYFGEHFENDGGKQTIIRHLVFMTYLNDVENGEGGGTRFKYQNINTKAKKGLTLIWPAAWTHTHNGIPSHTNEKYIITGWFSWFGLKGHAEEFKKYYFENE